MGRSYLLVLIVVVFEVALVPAVVGLLSQPTTVTTANAATRARIFFMGTPGVKWGAPRSAAGRGFGGGFDRPLRAGSQASRASRLRPHRNRYKLPAVIPGKIRPPDRSPGRDHREQNRSHPSLWAIVTYASQLTGRGNKTQGVGS